MSEPRQFPFGGVPVYNPQSLSKVEALAQFHARQATYASLMELLREERPSHVLIIGTRGMGKTTLLQRVRYGVEEDRDLNSRYLVLAFPEEQYNVNRLHHFLLNSVDAVADAMERLHKERMLARVDAYIQKMRKLSQEEIEEGVPQFLAEISHEMGRSLLLLVDNADRLFETIEDREQWRLRELLSSRHDLTLFGATTQASDGIYGTDRAFFEFFKIHRLAPLTFDEVRDLLLQLSESVDEKEGEKGTAKRRVDEWLAAGAARLRTLVQLTGGNPRTTVLLFHLVLDGLAGGAREYLEQLLDQCTPNYKGRVDELPPQAQQVLDAVALKWDPATASEIAEDTGLETNAVSTQLTRLVRQGLLEKADPGDSKKALYQVAERFFNIWYLMRASRRVRAKLRWFVEFLRVFFESDELEQMAWERLRCFRGAGRTRSEEIETAFAYALASGADRKKVEDYLRRECADREEEWRPFLELIPRLVELEGKSIGEASATAELGVGRNRVIELTGEVEAALRKAIEVDPNASLLWSALGILLGMNSSRAAEAETALRKAIEMDSNSALCWAALGRFLGRNSERKEEAEAALRNAIALDPKSASAWEDLGRFLGSNPSRVEEATVALMKAAELDPKSSEPWIALGNLLGRMPERKEEAEAALRKAIALDPKSGRCWANLGDLVARMPGRSDEAEAAFGKAVEKDPHSGYIWGWFGVFLACQAGKPREAEVALRKAVELAPDSPRNLKNLGALLFCEADQKIEAVQHLRRAHEIEPANAISAAILASCLGASEAEDELPIFVNASGEASFWDELLELCQNYAPFGKILIGICDMIQERDNSLRHAPLHRAVALAQLGDFPRASVALEDALVSDPIEQLSSGRKALEVFLAAAVRSGRVRDCLELIDRKEWKDAWRPIYEALKAVEAGSGEYLKRVAVEIREPAVLILRRIAPELPGLAGHSRELL